MIWLYSIGAVSALVLSVLAGLAGAEAQSVILFCSAFLFIVAAMLRLTRDDGLR